MAFLGINFAMLKFTFNARKTQVAVMSVKLYQGFLAEPLTMIIIQPAFLPGLCPIRFFSGDSAPPASANASQTKTMNLLDF